MKETKYDEFVKAHHGSLMKKMYNTDKLSYLSDLVNELGLDLQAESVWDYYQNALDHYKTVNNLSYKEKESLAMKDVLHFIYLSKDLKYAKKD